MTTMRSYFSLEQFEQVMQKLAHEVAVEAVTNMNVGTVNIVIFGDRISRVAIGTGRLEIKFYPKHLAYAHMPDGDHDAWWGFDVEEKYYLTSDHSTKISFYAPEGKEEQRKEKILKFIDKLMADAGIKPVPRFSLANHVKP